MDDFASVIGIEDDPAVGIYRGADDVVSLQIYGRVRFAESRYIGRWDGHLPLKNTQGTKNDRTTSRFLESQGQFNAFAQKIGRCLTFNDKSTVTNG